MATFWAAPSARSAVPSALDTKRVWMVMVASVPPPRVERAVSSLLAMTTARAPLSCAIFTLTVNGQVPRLISATLPVSVSAIDVQALPTTGTRLGVETSPTTETVEGPKSAPVLVYSLLSLPVPISSLTGV